jgi:hypothetical protein
MRGACFIVVESLSVLKPSPRKHTFYIVFFSAACACQRDLLLNVSMNRRRRAGSTSKAARRLRPACARRSAAGSGPAGPVGRSVTWPTAASTAAWCIGW